MAAHTRSQTTVVLVLAALATVAAAATSEAIDRVRVYYREGSSVSVQVIPDGRAALQFRSTGSDRYELIGDTQSLVGKSYALRIENHGRYRIKVVVGIDGVNAFFRKPVQGYARADVGAVLAAREVRTIKGFQLDGEQAQRFVFSPPEYSEGRGEGRVGEIELHVYEEWRPERDVPKLDEELSGRVEAARPGLGTTTGDDFDSQVRRVRFVSATPEPVARVVLLYGREEGFRPPSPPSGKLGVTIERHPSGCRVTGVEPGSIAEEVGLRRGDIIVKADSEDEPSPQTLRRVLRDKDRGDYLFLEVERGRHLLTFKIRM
ncbi:MAG TPA: PDZ domain-containing protein [Thermoanaerobaculaceae bacterium]|nr:PDZ domain-containing protein [Thermoanaerobaculaceae bacterium]HRS14964.1 PDZ domain-containing protein [Thermoanaerobaculaceae bacterium]